MPGNKAWFTWGPAWPVSPPLVPAAVYAIPDLDTLESIYAAETPGYIYARDGHPNADYLAEQINELEQARWGMITASGMAAISVVLLGLLAPGERIIVSDRLYGKTSRLIHGELRRLGILSTAVDICDLDAVERALTAAPARVLFTETISNPLCRVANLPRLAEMARALGVLLIVDNTFASPVLCRPLQVGAAVVVESLTKFLGGHSDLTLGYVGGQGNRFVEPWVERICAGVSLWGSTGNPWECWLTSRGLETLELRVAAACRNAQILADWLARQTGVLQVVYPGRADHPDHHLAGQLFAHRYGPMLAVELEGGRDAVNHWLRANPEIPLAPSLGHTRTTCSHPTSTSHRNDSPADRQRQGIRDGLLRFSLGCEPESELLSKFEAGWLRFLKSLPGQYPE